MQAAVEAPAHQDSRICRIPALVLVRSYICMAVADTAVFEFFKDFTGNNYNVHACYIYITVKVLVIVRDDVHAQVHLGLSVASACYLGTRARYS